MNVSESARSVSTHVDLLLQTTVAEVDQQELRHNLDDLRKAIAEVESFVASVESAATELSGEAPRRRRPSRVHRRGRTPDDFPVTSFILQSLRDNPKGLRPVDLKNRMTKAAPGRHTQPGATISTTLTRLKRKGTVSNRDGLWKLTRKSR